MSWSRKIAAWLYQPPYAALAPTYDQSEWQALVEKVMGAPLAPILAELAQAATWAAGLDIPPVASTLRPEVFREQPLLIHPLSGQEYALSLPGILAEETLQARVAEVLIQFAAAASSPETLFLALWRLLPERLAENNPTALGPLWQVLPADPRIPSHTVWEQASVRAAVAGAWPEPAILLFTIASAQKMVSAARRTQDAWMGSYLLSYLSWQAIKAVAEVCGPDAILSPALREQPLVDHWLVREKGLGAAGLAAPKKSALEIGSIPNIFAALVPANQAEALAQRAVAAVREGWEAITTKVRERVERAGQHTWQFPGFSLAEIWHRQAQGFLDNLGIFWVICPWGQDFQAVLAAVRAEFPGEGPDSLERLCKTLEDRGYQPHLGMTYSLLAGLTGRTLTARKNLRQFIQVEEPGHKCSLCGEWEAVHPEWASLAVIPAVAERITNPTVRANPREERYHYRWLRAFWEALGQVERTAGQKLLGRIRKGESLCSVCLTRRLALEAFFEDELGLDHHLFPSTAGIATAAWRGQLLDAAREAPELAALLEKLTKQVTAFVRKNDFPWPAAATGFLQAKARGLPWGQGFLELDGDWLYPEAYDEKALANVYGVKDLSGREACLATLRDLYQWLKDNQPEIGRPSKYYAILALDGDHMGEWVTGARAPLLRWLVHPAVRQDPVWDQILPTNYQRPLGPALQLALSDSLKNFALHQTRRIVEEEHAGKLIYAGGDDVLAFLPLADLVPVMAKLYQAFRGLPDGFQMSEGRVRCLLGGVRAGGPGEEPHEGMTLSMGAVIVHHSYPLYHALELVPGVLKQVAKKQLGRNAWAIRLLRRSGEVTEAGLPFGYDAATGSCQSLAWLQKVLHFFQAEIVASRLPYRLAEARWAFQGSDQRGQAPFDLNRARKLELHRLARQHSEEGYVQEVAQTLMQVSSLLSAEINKREQQLEWKERKKLQELDSWELLTKLLLLGRFLAGRED